MELLHFCFILLCIMNIGFCDNNNDDDDDIPSYAINPVACRELVILEESLVNTIGKFKISDEKCKSAIQMYLSKYLQTEHLFKNLPPERRAKMTSENPVLIFKLLYRLFKLKQASTILKQCSVEDEEKSVWDFIMSKFSSSNLTMPTREGDMRDALLGLIRMHYVYGFNASDLRQGKFYNMDTGATLDFVECLELGLFAMAHDGFVLTYQWFKAAEELAEDYGQFETLNELWLKLSDQTNKTFNQVRTEYHAKTQENLLGFANYTLYAACREEITNSSKGYCYYNRLFGIFPLKVEVFSQDPTLIQYHDFIGEKTLSFLKGSATSEVFRDHLESSTEDAPTYGDFVTGINVQLDEQSYDEKLPPKILKQLDAKMELASGMIVNASDVQMLLFGPFGFFDIHQDSIINSGAYREHIAEEKGDRIGQFFYYVSLKHNNLNRSMTAEKVLVKLSDVTLGGSTAFIDLGVYAKPLKGSAIFWFNGRRNGNADERTIHCGCPIILGNKQVIRMEINQHDNIWTRPCSIDSEK